MTGRQLPTDVVEEPVQCPGQLDLVEFAAAVEQPPEPEPRKERT